MTEYYLGDPVEKIVNGKTLRVELMDQSTVIYYGKKSLTLKNETVLEGLAVAVEWAIKELKND